MNNKKLRSKSKLVRSLGYLALGLGTAELFACRQVARLIGLRPTTARLGTLRMLGAREVLTGFGLLRRRPTPWLTARVLGDALDLGLLLRTLGRRSNLAFFGQAGSESRARALLTSVAGISALDLFALAGSAFNRRPSAGKSRPALRASITVERTPSDVYSFWRNVENLSRFMSMVESVTSPDQIRSNWKAKLASKATVEWDATVVEDTPDQRLLWKVQSSTMELLMDTVEVRFEPAPGGRGTEVHLILWGSRSAKPALASRWLRKLPEGLLFAQLHRFKQLIELGEITQSDSSIHGGPYPARPAATNSNSHLGAPS